MYSIVVFTVSTISRSIIIIPLSSSVANDADLHFHHSDYYLQIDLEFIHERVPNRIMFLQTCVGLENIGHTPVCV